MTQLSIQKTISTAFQVYRLRLGTFIKTSFYSYLWLFLSNLGLIGVYFCFIYLPLLLFVANLSATDSSGNNLLIILLSLVGGIIFACLAVFTASKGLRIRALIAWIASKELRGDRETLQTANRQVKRFWAFFLAQFYILLISLAFSLLAEVLSNIFPEYLAAIISLISLLFNIWMTVKFLFADIAIALRNTTALDSLKYSFQLSQGFFWQITIIVICIYLILLPAYIIPLLPFLFGLFSALAQTPTITSDLSSFLVVLSSLIPLLLISFIGLIIVGILTIPLWKSVKAVIYHELSEK